MGTTAVIAVSHLKVIKSITVHWDGYLQGVGQTLLTHYNSPKANHLVSLGNVSSLAKDLEPAVGQAHSFENPAAGVTVFYGRDRGEDDQDYEVYNSTAELLADSAEFMYIMNNEVWYVSQNGRPFENLEVAIAEELEAE
jgi:hypothetical protein